MKKFCLAGAAAVLLIGYGLWLCAERRLIAKNIAGT
jgi:hypothetical protein